MTMRAAEAGLRRALQSNHLAELAEPLMERAELAWRGNRHGDLEKWRRALAGLDGLRASSHDFARDAVRIGAARDCDDAARARAKQLLLQLQPWRKGPFDFFGMRIDAEWRADCKWARIAGSIDLRGRRALDIGCGNGYYLWRMLGAGASLALGIDPAQLFIAQFAACKRHCPARPAFALPLTCEAFPRGAGLPGFDAVFSMGVLSHRRDPHAHLREALQCARPGGEVIIETLVLEDDAERVFIPPGRYAKMRNVRSIPSPPMLADWLRQAGACGIRLLDISRTTPAEQRATEWMQFESLADFLDPADAAKTIEGHPAPCRAIFLCTRGE
ncbi:MAG: tRNA 5-methoxyuridine(34)/uridine 5-oxyacetic acid(34) synthase CmoB [Gammaproteobacteria bacterium]